MRTGTLRNIRLGMVFVTMFGGFLLWLQLPATVVLHFNQSGRADSWGNKVFLLVVFLLPLWSLIPWGKMNLPELHVDCEESRQELEEAKRKGELIQLVTAGVLCLVVWVCLLVTFHHIM